MSKTVSFFLMLYIFSWHYISKTQSPDLCELGNQFRTDKAYWHNYLPIYQKYLSPFQDKSIKFLEIGFYNGASAFMWDAYFTHKTTMLHFIDIDQNCLSMLPRLSDRCQLHLADQGSDKELQNFINKVGGSFDIINDDGGHTMNQQITTFKTLFPHLKPGGIYIIEDLHTSYWQSFGSAGTTENPQTNEFSTITFLKNLIDDLNYAGARTSCADKDKLEKNISNNLSYYQKHIHSLHFYSSLCIIIKQ